MNAPRLRPPTLLQAWLLASLLLAAQALGLAHRVQHAPGVVAVVAVVAQAPAATEHRGQGHVHDHKHGYGHTAGSEECRLIDQLGHAELAFVAIAGPALPIGEAAVPWQETAPAARARPAAAYWARGPPVAPLTTLA